MQHICSKCNTQGMRAGNHFVCPKCGTTLTDLASRIGNSFLEPDFVLANNFADVDRDELATTVEKLRAEYLNKYLPEQGARFTEGRLTWKDIYTNPFDQETIEKFHEIIKNNPAGTINDLMEECAKVLPNGIDPFLEISLDNVIESIRDALELEEED